MFVKALIVLSAYSTTRSLKSTSPLWFPGARTARAAARGQRTARGLPLVSMTIGRAVAVVPGGATVSEPR